MGQACCTETADNLSYDNTKQKISQLRVSTSKNVPLNLAPAKIPQMPAMVQQTFHKIP